MEPIEKLLNINMGIRADERVLVFTDHVKDRQLEPKEMDRCRRLEQTAELVAEFSGRIASTQFGKYDAFPSNGYEPPEPLWVMAFGKKAVDALKEAGLLDKLISKKADSNDVDKAMMILSQYVDDMVDAVIAMSNFSTSHTRFRHLLNKVKGTRYASMPLFDPDMFLGPMDADWNQVAERSEKIAGMLTRADRAMMTCPLGTEIRFGLKNRNGLADSGFITAKGSFGNLPSGEVYIAPVEGTSEGTMVLQWSTTRKLSPPVTLTVTNGEVKKVDGDRQFVAYLEDVFGKSPAAANIAELGIGTNDKASRPDNILEAEKILGTTHVAIGDNSAFGGRTSANFHEDYVFFSPTLIFEFEDGTSYTLIEKGKLKID